MRKHSVVVAVLLVAALGMAVGYSKHQRSRQATRGTPGQFDFYVLALSWSPSRRPTSFWPGTKAFSGSKGRQRG